MPLIRLRPVGLGELLDDVFRVYRRSFWLLVAIALIVSLPAFLIQFASGQADQFGFLITAIGSLARTDTLTTQQPPSTPNVAFLGIGAVVSIVLTPFTLGAIPRAVIDIVQGVPVTIRSALTATLHRYWSLMGLTLLYLLIAPLFICFPVAIWLFVRWSVAVPALLAERVGPIKALDRSWVLTRGHWWRLFGCLLLIYFLTSVISGALGAFAFPVAFVVPFVPPVVRGAIILTVETAAAAVVQPALYLCITLLYFDLRIRREDFDLDQLALQAAGSTP